MTQRENIQEQKRKLRQQDELIESMIGIDKENREISKEMGGHLKVQLKQMDKVDQDMDLVGSRMNKTNNRFKFYLKNTSYCKLYLLIFVQAVIILYLVTSI